MSDPALRALMAFLLIAAFAAALVLPLAFGGAM